MKELLNKVKKKGLDKRGSAIIMALVVMTVLMLLGLGVTVISMTVLKTNTTDASNNDAYYAAEAGVNSAIEQLKYETSAYYNELLNAPSAQFTALYNGFLNAICNNAAQHFIEPHIEGVITQTVFTAVSFDEAQSVCEYAVSCTAYIADGSSYVVNGTLFVKRLNLWPTPFNWINDNAAIKAGGTLDLETKNSVDVTGGNILVSNIVYDPNNSNPYTIVGGELIIDPFLADKIQDVLEYPSFQTVTISNPDVIIPSDGSINWSGLTAPISVVTADASDMHFSACTIPEGTVYVKGSVHLNNCIVNGDLYVDGDAYINNYTSINGNIYCRGNVFIDNATIDGQIYCDGAVDFNNGMLNSTIYCDTSIVVHNGTSSGNMFSTGPITIENANITDGIVYSKTKLTIGTGDMTAIFFSGGDIEFTGDVNVNGTVIAKNNIFFKNDANKDLYVNYQYSEETVEDIVTNPDNSFFFTIPGELHMGEEIFIDESVTAVGRVK